MLIGSCDGDCRLGRPPAVHGTAAVCRALRSGCQRTLSPRTPARLPQKRLGYRNPIRINGGRMRVLLELTGQYLELGSMVRRNYRRGIGDLDGTANSAVFSRQTRQWSCGLLGFSALAVVI